MIYKVTMFFRPGDGTVAEAEGTDAAHWVQVSSLSGVGGATTIFVPSANSAEKLAALINDLCAEPQAYDPTNMSVGGQP